ncbi:MAG TPA: Hsp20/alpha crystallin family protein [Oscillospiraceae bacterium]|nr:Hsp20/alpha crystallin family protein [Oscillospiraceae bacterium]
MFDLIPFERRHGMMNFNPFRDMEEFEKRFFGDMPLSEFKTDIRDAGAAFELEADLPGFKKEDIAIDLEGDVLTIRAERHGESEEKDKKGNYITRERCYGAFSRSFDVTGIKADEVTAQYADGVLKLTLPKKEAALPASRRLEIQ